MKKVSMYTKNLSAVFAFYALYLFMIWANVDMLNHFFSAARYSFWTGLTEVGLFVIVLIALGLFIAAAYNCFGEEHSGAAH